jgi:O-antigen ligase
LHASTNIERYDLFSQENGRHCWVAYLVAAICVFSFWSTSALEIGSVLLILLFPPLRAQDLLREARSLPFILWGIYVCTVLVSIALSPYPRQSFDSLNSLWHALLFPVAFVHRWSRHELQIISTSAVLSATIASAVVLFRFLTEELPYAEPSCTGLTSFTTVLALAGVVSIQQIQARMRAPKRELLLRWCSYAIITAAVFFAVRFTASLVLVAGSLALLAFLSPRILPLWLGIAGTLVVVSPAALHMKWTWIVSGGVVDRYVLWSAGLDLLARLPLLGYGPGSYWEILPNEALSALMYHPPSSWHNDFLQIFLESGWLAGLVFCGGILALLINLFRNFADKQARVFGTTLLGAMIVIAAADSVISTALLGTVWWLLLGGMVGVVKNYSA